MMGWTAINYYAAIATIVIIAAGATGANAYVLTKGKNGLAGLCMLFFIVVGLFGFIGLSAAPTYSYMERDHWEGVFKREAEQAQIEAALNEKILAAFPDSNCALVVLGTDETNHSFRCQFDVDTEE